MKHAARSAAERVTSLVVAIVFVLSFDRMANASAPANIASPVDDVEVNSTVGSLVFVLSIVAVLAIGAFVAWKTRQNRRW